MLGPPCKGVRHVDILRAKANRGIWGLAHVFDKKLYLTRDFVDADFAPKDLKPPKPAHELMNPSAPNNVRPVSPVAKRRRPLSMCKSSGCGIAGRRVEGGFCRELP